MLQKLSLKLIFLVILFLTKQQLDAMYLSLHALDLSKKRFFLISASDECDLTKKNIFLTRRNLALKWLSQDSTFTNTVVNSLPPAKYDRKHYTNNYYCKWQEKKENNESFIDFCKNESLYSHENTPDEQRTLKEIIASSIGIFGFVLTSRQQEIAVNRMRLQKTPNYSSSIIYYLNNLTNNDLKRYYIKEYLTRAALYKIDHIDYAKSTLNKFVPDKIHYQALTEIIRNKETNNIIIWLKTVDEKVITTYKSNIIYMENICSFIKTNALSKNSSSNPFDLAELDITAEDIELISYLIDLYKSCCNDLSSYIRNQFTIPMFNKLKEAAKKTGLNLMRYI